MMKKRMFGAVAYVALFSAVCGCGAEDETSAVARNGGSLVLVVSGEAPPFSVFDKETGEAKGIEIDIAKEAAAKLGRRLEVRKTEFEDLLPMVKSGEADMAASGLTITEGRLKSVDFSDSYAADGGAFLYRTGDPMPTMIRAESLRIATVDSMTPDFYLTRHGIDPVRYRSCVTAIKDLLDGKIDAFFYDRFSMKVEADNSGGRLSVSPLETRESYGIAVRKGFTELRDAINAVVAERRSR